MGREDRKAFLKRHGVDHLYLSDEKQSEKVIQALADLYNSYKASGSKLDYEVWVKAQFDIYAKQMTEKGA